ncbi:MAG: flavodoxin, partial [Prevotella sp.]|nr:flavodoxin [Prevotella sp.]
MKIFKFMMAIAALLTATACNGKKAAPDATETNSEQATQQVKTDKKALVVFFSHTGDNYSVGNIKVGNTKIVADYISEFTGADQFEIKTKKYDGMAYTPLTELAKEEQQNG